MTAALLDQFAVQANLLTADVVVAPRNRLASALQELVSAEHRSTVAVGEELTGYLPELKSLATGDAVRPDIAITLGRLLVAATGSVLLAESKYEDRLLRCIAGHHVAVTPAGSIVTTMAHAAAPLRANIAAGRRYATFATGPSRTGDIEQVISLGVHGPQKLTVVAVTDWALPDD